VLVPERVEAIYLDCLYRYGSTTRKIITVISPIDLHVLLHPEKVHEHKDEIGLMLDMLPDILGWGAPACEARRTCSGEVWTMNMDVVNMVLVLGVAIDRVWLSRPSDCNDVIVQII
jgi:hypothetical protein